MKTKRIRQELIQLTADTVEPDPDISQRMERFAPALQQADHRIGTLENVWTRADILRHCLATLAQIPGANAVLYSPESIRAEWPRGELRASRVYEALPWNNQIVKVALTAAQWEQLKSQTTHQWAEQSLPASADRVLVTSTFQAASLCDRLGLPRQFKAVSERNEYQFFVDSLTPAVLTHPAALPSNWKTLGNLP
jgi:2',3'-cyclic-nucleotide 2'-phosphodiesterase (5'-nucleotidase family)